MNIRMLLYIMTFALTASVYGQSSLDKVGTAGYQFLKIGHGARGVAMGDAYAPVADDASAVFWNPANLNKIDNFSIFTSHISYLADIKIDVFSAAKHVAGIGVFAINMVYMNSGEMEETTVYQQNGTGRTFKSIAYTFGISYARMLTDKFGIGANFKYVNEDLTNGLDQDNATGTWAVDLGTIYYPRFSNMESLRLIMSVRNFAPEIQLAGTYQDYDKGQLIEEGSEYKLFPLPLNFEFGVAMEPWEDENNRLTLSLVGVHPNDNSERVNLGAEYMFRNMFAVRGGYIINHDTRNLNAGFGIKLTTLKRFTFKLDYAFAEYGILESAQFFSLTLDW